MSILSPEHYPEIFSELIPHPDLLYYQGDPHLIGQPSVTIVGTRHPSPYGLTVCKQLVEKLISHDIVIISGFALGIDICAHRTALAGNGKTIAILGSGLDVRYPLAHHELKYDILKTGLILSEYPAGMRPRPEHFPKRNRLLAALADEVIVIECRKQSGTMITTEYAIDLGKPVHAVPGRITSELAQGPNQLIQDGANPIIDVDLFVDEYLRRNHVRKSSHRRVSIEGQDD